MIFKICGLREKESLICCEANKVDFFGLVFYEKSPRNINPNKLLSVNENCQLSKSNNIYVIDGSVFNFKKNKYPLGIIMANSRRVAKDI